MQNKAVKRLNTSDQIAPAAETADAATIAPSGAMQTPALAPYMARRMAPLGIWRESGFDIKAYGIRVDPHPEGALLPGAVIDAARRQVSLALREACRQGGHYGLAYVVLHAGEEANWLLVDWWREGGIVCQRLFSAPHHAAVTTFEPAAADLMACVWELVVVQHERNAWVRTMMTPHPDPAGYLADRMKPGLY